MMSEMTSTSIAVKSPQRCSSNELAEFTAFVLAGGPSLAPHRCRPPSSNIRHH